MLKTKQEEFNVYEIVEANKKNVCSIYKCNKISGGRLRL